MFLCSSIEEWLLQWVQIWLSTVYRSASENKKASILCSLEDFPIPHTSQLPGEETYKHFIFLEKEYLDCKLFGGKVFAFMCVYIMNAILFALYKQWIKRLVCICTIPILIVHAFASTLRSCFFVGDLRSDPGRHWTRHFLVSSMEVEDTTPSRIRPQLGIRHKIP